MKYLVKNNFTFMDREYVKNEIFSYPFSKKVKRLLIEQKIKPVSNNTIELKIKEERQKAIIK